MFLVGELLVTLAGFNKFNVTILSPFCNVDGLHNLPAAASFLLLKTQQAKHTLIPASCNWKPSTILEINAMMSFQKFAAWLKPIWSSSPVEFRRNQQLSFFRKTFHHNWWHEQATSKHSCDARFPIGRTHDTNRDDGARKAVIDTASDEPECFEWTS